MLLSRFRPGKKKKEEEEKKKDEEVKKADKDEFLEKRDYAGAISVLEYERAGTDNQNTQLWLAYCHFHAGDYKKSSEVLEAVTKEKNLDFPNEAFLYLGCAYFFQAMYEDARKAAERAPKNPLQNRLLFHVAHKLNDEKRLMVQHSHLKDTIEDQLCLASIHYLRSHYQQAIDIYKKLLARDKESIALNVYLALCYYKLDFYDLSMEALQVYLEQHKDSPIAVNLKACNYYRLYGAKAAETELKSLTSGELTYAKDVILHNTVVFRSGDAALQLLPTLVDIIPEARLNLVIYHLKKNDTDAAFFLMHHVEPQTTHELLLKAVTNHLKGVEEGSRDHLKMAWHYFRLVGESPTERDTIAGRQSMASALFLMKKYSEVLVYLTSIKSFFPEDDVFNFNYGQTLLMCEQFDEAEKTLLQVKNHTFTSSITYCLCLARSYIANGKAHQAWSLYQRQRHLNDSTQLIKLIANDCYAKEAYVVAARCFDELEGKEPRAGYDVTKRASCVGVVKLFTNSKANLDDLREIMAILERDRSEAAINAVNVIEKWAAEANVYF